MDQDLVKRLHEAWDALTPHEGPEPAHPALGYRGCSLQCPHERWQAYHGVVTRTRDRRTEFRHDPSRTIERLVLGSAPPGTLPNGLPS